MTRPDIQIPKEFAINGEKADFTQEKIQNGYDDKDPDIFAGDNLNKFIDDTYKGLNGVLDLYNGVVLHEMTTTYDDKAVVGKFIENNFKLYRSLVNDNTGHEVTESDYWEEVALGGGGGSGFSLFDTKVSDYVLNGEQAIGWELQGTFVNGAVYPDFYAECVSQKENATATETTLGDNTITMYINGNGHQFYDIADKDVVDIFYNTMGVAWFYGIDTENERVFLPRSNFFAVTGGVMGNGKALGLTDGTSNFSMMNGYNSNFSGLVENISGYGQNVGISGNYNPTTSAKNTGLTTDPTKSGITLEPDENKYLYICVGNTVVNENLVDVGKVMKEAVLRSSLVEADSHFSGVPMPSDKYIEMAFGANEADYTAPANGYFLAYWTASSANQYLTMKNVNSDFATSSSSVANSNTVRCWLPVRKNDVVKISYNVGTKNFLRFYYAEGEV